MAAASLPACRRPRGPAAGRRSPRRARQVDGRLPALLGSAPPARGTRPGVDHALSARRHNGGVHEPTQLPVIETPIACSLGATELTGRLADWRRVLAAVTARVAGDGPHEVVLQL